MTFSKYDNLWNEKTEPILRSRNDGPIEGSDNDTGNVDELEHSNIDNIKAWDSANEHMLSILRFTPTGAARSVLLQLEPNMVDLVMEERLG